MDDDDALREAIGRHTWFHSMELRPGVWTRGPKTPEILAGEAEAVLGPLDLRGRAVLDLGAWNGFFSFEAKRRGAARVLAADSFTWRHPDYRGREALELARGALGLEVETREVDVAADLPSLAGAFDVVLFLGVFYHLEDPLPVLPALRRLLPRGVLVLETQHDLLEVARPAMAHYPGAELGGDPTNWWAPNPPLVDALLRRAGFARVLYQEHPLARPGGPWRRHWRGIYHAFADDAAAAALVGAAPEGWLDLAAPGALASLCG